MKYIPQIGDTVIVSDDDEFVGGLAGTITGIAKLGTDDHQTENDADDIYIDFTGRLPWDDAEKKAMLEKRFSNLYGEPKTLEEMGLNEVIVGPDMLKPALFVKIWQDEEMREAGEPMLAGQFYDTDEAKLYAKKLIDRDGYACAEVIAGSYDGECVAYGYDGAKEWSDEG